MAGHDMFYLAGIWYGEWLSVFALPIIQFQIPHPPSWSGIRIWPPVCSGMSRISDSNKSSRLLRQCLCICVPWRDRQPLSMLRMFSKSIVHRAPQHHHKELKAHITKAQTKCNEVTFVENAVVRGTTRPPCTLSREPRLRTFQISRNPHWQPHTATDIFQVNETSFAAQRLPVSEHLVLLGSAFSIFSSKSPEQVRRASCEWDQKFRCNTYSYTVACSVSYSVLKKANIFDWIPPICPTTTPNWSQLQQNG